jgi:hypothetical protein
MKTKYYDEKINPILEGLISAKYNYSICITKDTNILS